MSDTPRLLRYTQLGNRELPEGELWVAIINGSPRKGGNGVVLTGHVAALTTSNDFRELAPALRPGGPFRFAANEVYDEGSTIAGRAAREVWGLDAAPPKVVAAWMRYYHKGLLV